MASIDDLVFISPAYNPEMSNAQRDVLMDFLNGGNGEGSVNTHNFRHTFTTKDTDSNTPGIQQDLKGFVAETSPPNNVIDIEEGTIQLGSGDPGNEWYIRSISHATDYRTPRYRMPISEMSQSFVAENIFLGLPTEDREAGDGNERPFIQLRNQSIDYGQRNETITMSGVIVEDPRSKPTPGATLQISEYDRVPTRKDLLNLCRSQWIFMLRGPSATTNPLNYTLFEFSNNERYRGFINNITFSIVGGKPGRWDYKLNFLVVKNENRY